MLRKLRLHMELKQKRAELDELNERKASFAARRQELERALEEAQTDEDIKLVEEGIKELESEIGENDIEEQASGVSAEVERIERELEEIDKAEDGVQVGAHDETTDGERERSKSMNKYQVRELLKTGEYYERAEVKGFYEQMKNLRGVTGGELTVPEIVVNRIMDIMGDYTTLYPLVDKVRANGTVRILLDTDTTAATWIEQNAAIPTGDVGTITDISFDGYKVGKVTFVDNCMLQDSIINLDDYVSKKIARSIALALDKAIVKGEGSTKKQPDGIIPKLSDTHKVTVTAPTGYADIVKPIGLIDTGEDSVGEIVAVMRRSTYYNRLLQYSIQPTSDGNVVGKLPNLRTPDLLGLRVVFNNFVDDDTILYGDFGKYTLVERETITIDSSPHVKFTEDQTGFRGKGRFDGKPTNANAFVLVTIADATVDSGGNSGGNSGGGDDSNPNG